MLMISSSSTHLDFSSDYFLCVLVFVLKVNTEVLHTTQTSYLYQLYSTTLLILLWDRINLNFNSLFDIASFTGISGPWCLHINYKTSCCAAQERREMMNSNRCGDTSVTGNECGQLFTIVVKSTKLKTLHICE